MLIIEWISLDGRATQLNKYALNDNCQDEDDDEPFVIEEVGKDVDLPISNLP
jgi:hypothetical protein